MNKRFLLFLSLILCISESKSFAQDELLANRAVQTKKDTKIFSVQSLEGKIVKVKIVPDYVHNILCISYLKDTVNILDYWGVPSETVHLTKKFPKINYEVRGGSNLGLGNTLVICVSRNKLYEALHVLRYADWESGDLTKAYNIKLVPVNNKQGCTLKANIFDKVLSKDNPETNYNYTNSTKLHFDNKLKVFYSIKDFLNDTLKICYPNLTYKREIEGTFPKVLLGKEEYVFIGGQWFQSYNGTLNKY